jgi:DNA modification methylase
MAQKMKISDIKANPNNPRIIKDEKFANLVESVKSFPEMLELRPIVVNKDMIILWGNMRFKACKEAWYKEIPVIVADNLTEEQEREFLIKDNVSGGEWDWDILANEWNTEELTEWWLDVPFVEEVPEAEEDDFDTTPPEEPITVLWDLYEIGEHRLLCWDSTDIVQVEKLMNWEKADMVFTDPPYGISFEDTKWNKIQNDNLKDDELIKFNDTFQRIAYNVSKDDCFMIIWQSPRLFHLLNFFGEWRFFRLITLYKSNRISFPHWAWINKTEPWLVFVKWSPKISKEKYTDDCFVYTHDKESHDDSNVWHPTPKPPILAENNIMACTNKGELILDLFLWSGTTMVASNRHWRRCNGMELDPKYCDVIVNRMQKLDSTLIIKRNWVPYIKPEISG